MRTELLAAAFFTCALLMLLIARKRGERWWRPAVVGCASLLITLAMLNKIQFLFSDLHAAGPAAAVRHARDARSARLLARSRAGPGRRSAPLLR